MSCLFGDVGEMRFEVKLITSAAELICGVVFYTEACELRRTIESPQTEGVRRQFTNLRESIAIVIVGLAVAV